MRSTIERLIQKYGSSVIIHTHGTTYDTKVLLQIIASKSWQNMVGLDTPLGEVPRGQYIYIGPPEVAAKDGDILTVGDKDFVFRRVEPYFYGDTVVYLWGLCMEKGVNDTWGSRS